MLDGLSPLSLLPRPNPSFKLVVNALNEGVTKTPAISPASKTHALSFFAKMHATGNLRKHPL